ncbi:ATP-dependent protease LonB [Paenibacillus thiaminolyticus]|uniref:endopeptidase La n=1 Tax=Paenibacillus thiaminolyticus TaxID=49283 RepID=A0AAP9J3Q5_PANTH|nr:ATP-dependent protease LonB [Paenibacillus thiaminolyticus]MCY9537281.1 ATP-dependent protease LonB [Paenibacillus thiaminolyticus]MCY9600038.1 ATP-dependent protease LonB [Paenibacillus thiaminolyticus]MCY9610496.1 ATP-dependent protease LonB [Paenibacillus thiaminolyticus]MCY9615727.1 ATP-dependent protease LonB [Paenibacillus thiaminolyticus]MCY9617091.1 ATP-dependent protease LonB [Paenibacillus thiaminolyticus]
MNLSIILMLINAFFAVVIGIYFWNLLRNQKGNRTAVDRESKKEMDKLNKLRSISLTKPLAEKTRPTTLNDIVGQRDGLKALKAALCSSNPQHVIVYGPPGVGKTAAARVVLEEAKKNPSSPFTKEAKFTEIDATTARFDERGIADPLIGSVHDPIYQGAGAMGVAGIPQPKPGAVTKAHGGMLFIDEIGELHPIQMNKLLKVLEDRKVFLESAYYNSEDSNIPTYIHDIFQNGLPADFRLVGATTRSPQELPPALRSRCMEVYFRPLLPAEIESIAEHAVRKIGFPPSEAAVNMVKRYATNGREAVNMIQLAAGLAMSEGRSAIEGADVEWVANSSQIPPRPDRKVPAEPQIGLVNGLAVYGPNMGALLEIEVNSIRVKNGTGTYTITGVVDEEELGGGSRTLRRKSMAKGSVENVLTVLRSLGYEPSNYDLHINFPGGSPVDGPSAGVAMVIAIASSMNEWPVDNKLAMTGEISIHGRVKPVGGVLAKVEAAFQAGATRVLIPKENWLEIFADLEGGLQVIPMEHVDEAFAHTFGHVMEEGAHPAAKPYERAAGTAMPLLHAEASEKGAHPDSKG